MICLAKPPTVQSLVAAVMVAEPGSEAWYDAVDALIRDERAAVVVGGYIALLAKDKARLKGK